MIKNQISYWNNFYKKVGSHKSPTNFAKFKNENPKVLRLCLKKR